MRKVHFIILHSLASAELMMANSEGKIMLLIGEAFIETSEEDANECKMIK